MPLLVCSGLLWISWRVLSAALYVALLGVTRVARAISSLCAGITSSLGRGFVLAGHLSRPPGDAETACLVGLRTPLRALLSAPNLLARNPFLAPGSFARDLWFLVLPASLAATVALASLAAHHFPAWHRLHSVLLRSHRQVTAALLSVVSALLVHDAAMSLARGVWLLRTALQLYCGIWFGVGAVIAARPKAGAEQTREAERRRLLGAVSALFPSGATLLLASIASGTDVSASDAVRHSAWGWLPLFLVVSIEAWGIVLHCRPLQSIASTLAAAVSPLGHSLVRGWREIRDRCTWPPPWLPFIIEMGETVWWLACKEASVYGVAFDLLGAYSLRVWDGLRWGADALLRLWTNLRPPLLTALNKTADAAQHAISVTHACLSSLSPLVICLYQRASNWLWSTIMWPIVSIMRVLGEVLHRAMLFIINYGLQVADSFSTVLKRAARAMISIWNCSLRVADRCLTVLKRVARLAGSAIQTAASTAFRLAVRMCHQLHLHLVSPAVQALSHLTRTVFCYMSVEIRKLLAAVASAVSASSARINAVVRWLLRHCLCPAVRATVRSGVIVYQRIELAVLLARSCALPVIATVMMARGAITYAIAGSGEEALISAFAAVASISVALQIGGDKLLQRAQEQQWRTLGRWCQVAGAWLFLNLDCRVGYATTGALRQIRRHVLPHMQNVMMACVTAVELALRETLKSISRGAKLLYLNIIRTAVRAVRTTAIRAFKAVWNSPAATLVLSAASMGIAYRLWLSWAAISAAFANAASLLHRPLGAFSAAILSGVAATGKCIIGAAAIGKAMVLHFSFTGWLNAAASGTATALASPGFCKVTVALLTGCSCFVRVTEPVQGQHPLQSQLTPTRVAVSLRYGRAMLKALFLPPLLAGLASLVGLPATSLPFRAWMLLLKLSTPLLWLAVAILLPTRSLLASVGIVGQPGARGSAEGRPQDERAKLMEQLRRQRPPATTYATTECCLCLEPLLDTGNESRLVQVLRCGHQLHGDCALDLLARDPRCPLCRRPALGADLAGEWL